MARIYKIITVPESMYRGVCKTFFLKKILNLRLYHPAIGNFAVNLQVPIYLTNLDIIVTSACWQEMVDFTCVTLSKYLIPSRDFNFKSFEANFTNSEDIFWSGGYLASRSERPAIWPLDFSVRQIWPLKFSVRLFGVQQVFFDNITSYCICRDLVTFISQSILLKLS